MNPDPLAPVPPRHVPPPLTIADEPDSSQPARPCPLQGRIRRSAISTNAGRRSHAFGLAQRLIQDRPMPELIEQGRMTRIGPQAEASRMSGSSASAAVRAIPSEQLFELGEDLDQKVLAAYVGEGVMLNLAVVAIGLYDADIFVEIAAGGANLDSSQIHVAKYHDASRRVQAKSWELPRVWIDIVTTLFEDIWGWLLSKPRKTEEIHSAPGQQKRFHPNMG